MLLDFDFIQTHLATLFAILKGSYYSFKHNFIFDTSLRIDNRGGSIGDFPIKTISLIAPQTYQIIGVLQSPALPDGLGLHPLHNSYIIYDSNINNIISLHFTPISFQAVSLLTCPVLGYNYQHTILLSLRHSDFGGSVFSSITAYTHCRCLCGILKNFLPSCGHLKF